MWAVAILSLLLLTKLRRRWKRRTANICTMKRLFLMKLHFLLRYLFSICSKYVTLGCEIQELVLPKKMLFIANLRTRNHEPSFLSDIINFFKDVGKVVRVRIIKAHIRKPVGCSGFVEFASANEAKKMRALQKKNGEYLHSRNIFFDVAYRGATYLPPPKYCINHKVCGNYFKDAVRVRLIVDDNGNPVGCCFVEFASANLAEKAVKEGHPFFVRMAEIDRPYPFRSKYKLAERLWYEDSLLRENLCKKSKRNLVKQFSGKRTTFSDDE